MVREVEMSRDWFRSVFIVNLNIPKVFAETITQSAARFADVYFFALLISYKRDKNLSKSTLKSDHQPGTFKCERVRCRTCPFVSNANKISGPKRTVAITDHLSCISTNLIYCITCTLCKKVYIGETGRRLSETIHSAMMIFSRLILI